MSKYEKCGNGIVSRYEKLNNNKKCKLLSKNFKQQGKTKLDIYKGKK